MSINQYFLDTAEHNRQQVRTRNKWMIRIRWYYLIILTLVATSSTLLTANNRQQVFRYLAIGLCGMALNGLLWLITTYKSGSIRYFYSLAIAQILLDLGLASYVIYLQGGLLSRATVLYAVPILTSGILFLRSFAYFTATISTIAYGLSLYYASVLHPNSYTLNEIVVPTAFYGSVFMILASIISRYSAINILDEREKSYGELLAMLRHQLRHPSGVIAALVEMLESAAAYKQFTPKEQKYLKQIKEENRRLNSMISNLLEAVQNPDSEHVNNLETINLIQLIEETANLCATSARRTADLHVNYPIEALHVLADPMQIKLAFENIIENAFNYSEPGSKVNITIRKKDSTIHTMVADHGNGMTAKQQRQLFNRFTHYEEGDETTKQLYSMGLGLYVSRLIIERYGGSVHVESELKKGTTITIKLKGKKNEEN